LELIVLTFPDKPRNSYSGQLQLRWVAPASLPILTKKSAELPEVQDPAAIP